MANKPGPKPELWITGPDPVVHQQYRAWSQHRAQARFRSEPYELTWPQWQQVWAGQWHLRGRRQQDIMMVRTDLARPWARDNIQFVRRSEFGRWQQHHRQQRESLGIPRPYRPQETQNEKI